MAGKYKTSVKLAGNKFDLSIPHKEADIVFRQLGNLTFPASKISKTKKLTNVTYVYCRRKKKVYFYF